MIKPLNYLAIVFVLALIVNFSCKKDEPTENKDNKRVEILPPKAVEKTNNIMVYAHLMPWFETPETSGNNQWGSHWTMANMNPEIFNNGKRQIAAHYYPLTGPYASSDPDIIEYQLLLMKYAGIDGVIIDWYGTIDLYDYPNNLRNANALIELLPKTGLKFAIVYEDRTIKAALEKGTIDDAIYAARTDMEYLENNYFNSASYIKIDGKPLLMVFGPEYFTTPAKWAEVFENMAQKPCFLTLNGRSAQTAPASTGEYIWVDAVSIENRYKSMNNFGVFMGGAYPGFHDYYKEGGWGDGYPLPYPHNNGELFKANLNLANKYKPKHLQLITWNDYGEGTMIEPTEEFGFSFLEAIQEFSGTPYSKTELEHIFKLYQLRKKYVGNTTVTPNLNLAFNYYVSLQNHKANNIIDSLMQLQQNR